ncbi:hypothetical protein JCGZ_10639 [Jatropha curcas]|uniref:Uncharacterized protein n=1 Tax=Jatropha curcas TaxID=180498 RepID=A0A067J8Z7_JATCU|nr:hypothetical protein JCGZ_10639 [Jatropha curcas]
MDDSSILILKIERLVEKIVVASSGKLLQSDKGKDHMVIEDDEAKGEFEKKDQVADTWQDEEFLAKKVTTKKAEVEPIISEKFEKLDKKLEKLHVFMKSKGTDQYVDMDDDENEKLELKNTI